MSEPNRDAKGRWAPRGDSSEPELEPSNPEPEQESLTSPTTTPSPSPTPRPPLTQLVDWLTADLGIVSDQIPVLEWGVCILLLTLVRGILRPELKGLASDSLRAIDPVVKKWNVRLVEAESVKAVEADGPKEQTAEEPT